MKITFIISTLNSGGAERVLVTLANEFCKHHQVKIIKFSQDPCFYALDERVKLRTLERILMRNLYEKIIGRLKRFFSLRKALFEEKSDVFISFLDTTNIACILAKWGLKTPLILSEHSHESYLKSKIWRILRRLTYGYCDALCVLGQNDKKYYKKFVKNVQVMLNPCHFSTEVIEKIPKDKKVLFVGRLDENKNAAMFIKMVRNLDKKIQEEYEFCIAGDGILRENLEKLAFDLKVKINFLGRVSDMKSLYQRTEFLCLCSFVEGLPTVLIESLFFDILRISTDYTDGARDLIEDGKDGFIVPKNDDVAMSKVLMRLIQNDVLKQEILENSAKKRQEFSTPFIAKQWLELIHKVIKAKE